jgi:hypothetical protein
VRVRSNTKVRSIPRLALVWRSPYRVYPRRVPSRWLPFIYYETADVLFEQALVYTGTLEECNALAVQLNGAYNLGRSSALVELK